MDAKGIAAKRQCLRTEPFSGTGIAINFYGEEGVEPARERRHELTRQDLNQHQVDFAIFATRNPLSHGAILADEVRLDKTIEAVRFE